MNSNTLSNALPIVAATYGRRFGVPVVVGGDTAGTDGTTIHIPTVPDEPGTKSLAWGYLTRYPDGCSNTGSCGRARRRS
jgi:hypothetical protein